MLATSAGCITHVEANSRQSQGSQAKEEPPLWKHVYRAPSSQMVFRQKALATLLSAFSPAVAFSPPHPRAQLGTSFGQALGMSHRSGKLHMMAPVEPSNVIVKADALDVASLVMSKVEKAAEAAIADRGHFALAIPGGSVLDMLAGTAPSWASKTTLAYVNHKAVPMDDKELATHAKASAKFLDQWDGVNAIVMNGSGDAPAEAVAYEKALRELPESKLPRGQDGLPIFDMMLIGVGDDGHVGSLYPGRDEVADTSGKWVLPVEMKVPGSITLSLPVMAAAKEVVIGACGVSPKYPQGKSASMAVAIEGDETPSTFPAVGLRGRATWIFDEAAASKLSDKYAKYDLER